VVSDKISQFDPPLPQGEGFSHETFLFLERLDISTSKLGLERMRQVLATLKDPQDAIPMIHVAGTNGKGSVTAMLSAILKAAGHRVGRFTSPHLFDVRERIVFNEIPISVEDFETHVQSLKAHLESLDWLPEQWPTYFEFLNILAYRYFLDQKATVTVFETGLGGRLDSTNVVSQPCLTVITSISMDHMQYLGDTLAQIAAEKAGILKK
jgi:dihydrofolate synthase/folylpolyglutamate synthase